MRNEVIATAKADADRDTNKFVWVGSGCLVSGIATFLPKGYWLLPLSFVPRFYQPGPPPARLVGKSPEYVATYVAAYKSERGEKPSESRGHGMSDRHAYALVDNKRWDNVSSEPRFNPIYKLWMDTQNRRHTMIRIYFFALLATFAIGCGIIDLDPCTYEVGETLGTCCTRNRFCELN